MANVTIIGAGHWGIALASVVAANGYNVLVYARRKEAAEAINDGYSNYFKDIKLNKNIKATSNIDEAVSFSNIIVVAIPVATIYSFMNPIIQKNTQKIYLFTSKGLYNGRSISSLFYEENKDLKLTVLSGPSFASEVMDGKNTAVVIASDKTNVARQLQIIFNNAHFRVYTTDDIIGVEYCGAIKNVFAIICGMIDGANMGTNTKNAIITRGLNEIGRVISFVGGNPKTLYGLAGIGDIMLTCNSLESRNYSYGFHYTKDASLLYNQNGTIEGLNTINEIYKIAKDNNLEMPIIESLYNILFNNSTIDVESLKLMKRDMKDE